MERIVNKIEENKKSKKISLYINNYSIDTLPDSIGELSHLKVLDLSNNSLKYLPKEIGNLKNLEILDLRNNQIEELPIEISFLKRLESLYISNNRLKELPLEIINLNCLEEIKIEKNPITKPPLEICARGIHSIKNYFKAIENSQENLKLFEAKLLIVGEGNVGKTQIMNNIIGKHEFPVTTEGIDIQKWYFNNNQTNFRINIWDFGGQEIYHATHQFFLTKRSLYIFVWNARTDDNLVSFDYWLNIIRLIGSESPVIIVQNKIDERIKNLDEHLIGKSFSNIKGFHKVSATKGTNMNNLIEQIKKETLLLDHIGDTLPKVWNDIRIKLESLSRNFITHDEYLSICSDFGLDENQSDYISQYYHDIGVFLHFHGSSILNEIIFLKPEWATNAVYKLIDTKEVIKNYGKFYFKNLKKYWKDYPTENYIHLIELMKKFELCFELSGTDNYIIPELLNSVMPQFEWRDIDNLVIRYGYEFMPKGIITRFIVRNHDLILDNYYWKNGLIIQRENTLALIVCDEFRRIIDIKIEGYDKSGLLSIISREMDYIHKTLNYPSVKKQIPCNCDICQNNANPHYYDYETLKRYEEKNKKDILCPISIEEIKISDITYGIDKIAPKGTKEGLTLIENLNKCKLGKKDWSNYETICKDIFVYLFKEDFQTLIIEEQTTSFDKIFRRDLLVSNNYKNNSSFWGRMANQYKSRVIVVEFKNYSEKITQNEINTTSKYLNAKIGYFGIIISRKGLDINAELLQKRELSENKLLLSLRDKDLFDMIDLKMKGLDPKSKLDQLLFEICKKE